MHCSHGLSSLVQYMKRCRQKRIRKTQAERRPLVISEPYNFRKETDLALMGSYAERAANVTESCQMSSPLPNSLSRPPVLERRYSGNVSMSDSMTDIRMGIAVSCASPGVTSTTALVGSRSTYF